MRDSLQDKIVRILGITVLGEIRMKQHVFVFLTFKFTMHTSADHLVVQIRLIWYSLWFNAKTDLNILKSVLRDPSKFCKIRLTCECIPRHFCYL